MNNKPAMAEYQVGVDQLRIGVFIRLKGVKWLDHPFFFSAFKITKVSQIQALRNLGITGVICVPEKSDVLPLPQKTKEAVEPLPQADAAEERQLTRKLWQLKQERIALNKERRAKAEKCEAQFKTSVEMVKSVMQNIETVPQETFREASFLMHKIVETLMAEKDVSVQLMNTNFGQENVFFHSLNVSILSMMLGKEYGLDADALRVLGLGALFHDVGKNNIPRNILRKKNLSGPEKRFFQLHPKYGVDILSKIEHFPKEALEIVYQHHERYDGQGYPLAVSGEKISVFARIASIVNIYDNHCNTFDYQESLTPYEALAYMFSVQGDLFDKELLTLFIRCLGVYPPGTIVKLSNGSIGMVVTVDSGSSLQPSLILYDPDIPKKEALIVSLREEQDLFIEGSIRPQVLPQNIYDYLSPRTRITYYVNESAAGADKPKA